MSENAADQVATNGQDLSVAPATPEPSSTPADSYSNVLSHFKDEYGWDASQYGLDGKAALKQLVAAATRGPDPQLVQQARYGQQYAELQASPQWKKYQDWLKQQEQPQPAKEPEGFKWELPKFNSQWAQHVQLDPRTGAYVPREDNPYFSPTALAEANAYREAQEEHSRRLLHEFPQLVEQIIAPKLVAMEKKYAEQWRSEWERQQSAQQTQGYLDQFERELYQHDAQGNPVLDAMGNRVPAPHGQLMQAHISEANQILAELSGQYGKPIVGPDGTMRQLEPWEQHFLRNYVISRTGRDAQLTRAWNSFVAELQQQQQPQEPPAPPEPTPEERNAALIDRTFKNGSRARREQPGTATPTRKKPAVAATAGAIPSIRDRFNADFGL